MEEGKEVPRQSRQMNWCAAQYETIEAETESSDPLPSPSQPSEVASHAMSGPLTGPLTGPPT